MNYLAHAYLSFDLPEILVGNMISDFVKGKKKFIYPINIQKGITLHRAIDTFTDEHPVTHEAKRLFKSAYGLYSGAFMDIVYDHFLACDAEIFDDKSLVIFCRNIYNSLNDHAHIFPENFSYMFPYMKEHNWLYNYQFKWGIEKSFSGLVHRAAYMDNSEAAVRIFESNYYKLEKYYREFFPSLREHAFEQLNLLMQAD